MNEVNIYVLDCDALKDETLFEKYYSQMSPERRQKIDRLRFDSDKRLSLGAGILLQKALGDYAKSAVLANEHGKPYVDGCPLKFSISHSGKYAAVATAETEIGCDIQIVKPEQPLRIAEKFFCKSECDYIFSGENKTERFFRLWALKESYVKALGTGLAAPLNSFAVTFIDNMPHISGDYSLAEFHIDDDYSFAVCVKGKASFNEPINVTV